MKNIKNKFLDVPIPYVITGAVVLVFIAILAYQGDLSLLALTGIALVATLIGLQVQLGSIVIKNVVGVIIVLYVAALYTFVVGGATGYVTQPFLFTLAGVGAFLSQSYSKSRNFDLRSRSLWASILAITLVSVKIAVLLDDFSFWFAEFIGLNVLIIYILSWRLWITHSRKTKINKPDIIEEQARDNFKYIYIENKLEHASNKWWHGRFTKPAYAYPYIYHEVMKAHENDLILVIVSKYTSSELYDVGEIKINKTNKIPYLYMEAKDEEYEDIILPRFIEEITRYKK